MVKVDYTWGETCPNSSLSRLGPYRPRQLGSQDWSLKQELYAARIDAHREKPTSSVVGGCHLVISVRTSSSISLWVRPTFCPANFTLLPHICAYLNSSFILL